MPHLPLSASYLDYASPALAAGAMVRKGDWHVPGTSCVFGTASQACEALGVTPAALPMPRTRTMKAIEREARTIAGRSYSRSDRGSYTATAFAYVQVMPQHFTIGDKPAGATYKDFTPTWATASDGSKRIRAVTIGDASHLIPAWDYIPDTLESATLPLLDA